MPRLFTSGAASDWMQYPFVRFFATVVCAFVILIGTLLGVFYMLSRWQ